MAEEKKNKLSGLSRLVPKMKAYWPFFLLLIALILIINVSELLKPYILEIIIDNYLKKGVSLAEGQPIVLFGLIYFI
jgi:ATP-binding cassette, subfamily B, multidrug efflux pump